MTDVNNAGEVDAQTGGENEGGGNDGLPTWMSSLPDEYKQNEVLAKYENIGDAAKDLVTFKSDGNLVRIPGEDASDEDRATFYSKLGRPEKHEDYKITKPADLPKDLPYTPEIESMFKQIAFDLNLSQGQASELHGKYYDLVKQGYADEAKEEDRVVEEAIGKLKDEWKGDDYKKNEAIAVRAFKKFGEGFESLLDEKVGNIRLGNHPTFLKLFNKIGSEVLDDSAGDRGGSGSKDTDSDKAKAEAMYPDMK